MGFPARSQHPAVGTAFAYGAPVLPSSPGEMQRPQPPFYRGKKEDLLKVTQQVRCRQGLGPRFNTQAWPALALRQVGHGVWYPEERAFGHPGAWVLGWEAGAGARAQLCLRLAVGASASSSVK